MRQLTIQASINQDRKLNELREKIDEAKVNGDKTKIAVLTAKFKEEYKKQYGGRKPTT